MQWTYERDIAQMRADIAAGKDVDIVLLKSLLVMLTDIKEDAYMYTHSGRKVYLFRCTPDDMLIDDIAWSLARINRFCGHLDCDLMSVAQHSTMMLTTAVGAPIPMKKCILLHDAEECYTNDLPRPVKTAGVNWAFEMAAAHIRQQIIKRFGLDERLLESMALDSIDKAQCEVERKSTHTIVTLSPKLAQSHFMVCYRTLFQE